jgi:hypothetical protein
VSKKEMAEQSLLAKVCRLTLPGIWFRTEKESELVLSVMRENSRKLQSALLGLPPDGAVAVLTEPDHRANACIVWRPGESGNSAITPPGSDGSSRTGNFLLFTPQQDKNEVRYFEDGVVVMLTTASWVTIRDAVQAGKRASISVSGAASQFSLDWIQGDYYNPVDGLTYHTNAGWTVYGKEGGVAPEKGGPVTLKLTRFLTNDQEMRESTTVEELLGYYTSIEDVLRTHFAPLPRQRGQNLIVQCELYPDRRAGIKLASEPWIDAKVLASLYETLKTVRGPEVKKGPLKLQFVFALWGGAADPPLATIQ